MSYISFDYICVNLTCTEINKKIEKTHSRNELQLCQKCEEPLKRLPCGPSAPHISWSTWKI